MGARELLTSAWKSPRLRRALPDAFGLAVAALYGAPTVAYGFGRDQAIFYYMGREWLWHGSVPYRDIFDVKPPAIYATHALAILLFGANTGAIRVLELLGVLVSGWLIAAAVRRDRPRAPGEVGAAAMLLASFYYTNFDYWDSGQVEFWQGMFTLASYVAVEKVPSRWKGAAWGGVLGGLAVMYKPTDGVACVLLGVLAAVRAFQGARRGGASTGSGSGGDSEGMGRRFGRAVGAIGLYGVCSLAVVGLFVLYFVAVHAWPSLVELVKYQRAYSQAWAAPSKQFVHDQFKLIWWTRGQIWTCAFGALWLLGVAGGIVRRSGKVLAGAGFALVLTGLAFGAVAVQQKFWWYHWGITAHFLALMAAYGLAEMANWAWPLAPASMLGLLVAGFVHAPAWLSNPATSYRKYVKDDLVPYLQHKIDHVTFDRVFVFPQHFNYADQERIALAIKARARPGDLLHSRAFELGFAVLTGMHSPARFASESPIEEAALAFNVGPWQAEHDRVLWTTRPRFIVTFADRVADIRLIKSHGYHELLRSGLYVGLERDE